MEAFKSLLHSDDEPEIDFREEFRQTQSLWNLTGASSQNDADEVPVLLNWYPNTLTLNSRLVRLGIPDCAALRARPSKNTAFSANMDNGCAFEVNQLVKVSWAGLAQAAPLIVQLMDRLNITQSDYIELLQGVSSYSYCSLLVPHLCSSVCG